MGEEYACLYVTHFLLVNALWIKHPMRVRRAFLFSIHTRGDGTGTGVRLKLKRTVKTERALKLDGRRKISKDYSREIPELTKHRINVRMILQHSNATPIRCRSGIGYACCFCTEQFPDPAHLKIHNLEYHDNDKADFMKGKMMSAFLVKLDITALRCTVCNKPIDTLEELVDHLITFHNKKLYTDIKSHILPFKFDGVVLKCIYCSQIFSKFKLILEHMNTHFRNYVCEVCDAGYVSRKILDTHTQGHRLGIFQCDFCEKVFDTFRKKRSHEKSVHIHSNFVYKCGYCNVKFPSSSKKEDHIIKIHGVEASNLEFNCRSCGKIFDRKRALRIHIQRDHLMERRYACELCEMKFFLGCDLKQHMLKHTGIKEFKCDVCLKSYGRKNTLKEHMRIHADDRRFKCVICDQAFVQKCTWKSHMRSKHKEFVVN